MLKQYVPNKIKWAIKVRSAQLMDELETSIARSRLAAEHPSLSIFDNRLPDLKTAYRQIEFNEYLEAWPDAKLYSSLPRNAFTSHIAKFKAAYPQFSKQISRFHPLQRIEGRAAYFLFLSGANRYLETIEANRLAFAFTLYPGGGFYLHDAESDQILKRIFASPYFRKVIVTQNIAYEYLTENGFCDNAQVKLLYGAVLPSQQLADAGIQKKRYRQEKDTFDICFVAYKYMRGGKDKGYDRFIEVARRLASFSTDIRFHVVGNFNEADVEMTDIQDRVIFYGRQPTEFFPDFYSQMDLILSANRPFTLHAGAFDGFPTASCVEAMLCQVAAFCTDPLRQNIAFKQGYDIEIIDENADNIADIIIHYSNHLDALYALGRHGQKTCAEVFSPDRQIRPRIELLSDLIAEA